MGLTFPRRAERLRAMNIHHHRGGLRRTRERLGAGRLTVGFIGGSITDPRPGYNWPEPVMAWFVERFPQTRFVVENAAIGATSSDLAVFRAQRDLIDRQCDIVFVEYAVNDYDMPTAERTRTREGLLRKLLAGAGCDVVLVYTFCQNMYADMMTGQVPASIREFEELGAHYNIGSVWMGLHALREVQAGQMRWEEWLPDGLHPQNRGSLSYAQAVTAFLERELNTAPATSEILTGSRRPAPLNPQHWEGAHRLSLDTVELEGPWTLRRWPHMVWMDLVLDTAAVGAKLKVGFEGRAVSVGFDFGKTSADFRYSLDDQPWVVHHFDRPVWCGPTGWFRTVNLANDLPPGRHTLRMEVIHGDQPECNGTNFRLALIGVVP
jgi:GDSL-like Lipase/Acylhydrolase family